MTIIAVHHRTRYRYRRPVHFGDHRVVFRPRDSFDQRLLSSELEITPKPKLVRWMHDVFGNCVAVASFSEAAEELLFETRIVLEHTPEHAPHFLIEDYARFYPFTYSAEEMPDLGRLIERQYLDRDHLIDEWARQFTKHGQPIETTELLMTLTYAIKEGFTYLSRQERGTQDPLTTFTTKRGSCRDFAVLMMDAARSLGLAARFVSGYLHVPRDENDDFKGGGNTHAWCQIYLPGAGWVEFDPTNGIVGNQNLIRVAVTRDPRQATPLWGTFYGSDADSLGMDVEVDTFTIDG